MNAPGIPTELTRAASNAIAAQFDSNTIVTEPACPVTAEPFSFGGFSDTEIIRLSCKAGRFALRSWPNAAVSHERVNFWNAIQEAHSDRSFFPKLVAWPSEQPLGDPAHSAWLRPFGGKLWTLSQWIEGLPVNPVRIDKALIEHLASTLGRLHATSMAVSQLSGSSLEFGVGMSASLLDRKRAIDSFVAQSISISHHVGINGWLDQETATRVEDCLSQFANQRAEMVRFAELISSQKRMCHWIVRDLWFENILVTDSNQFASIVDLGAARLDWPGLDFVRLFGSLIPFAHPVHASQDDRNALWENALRCYRSSHPDHAIGSIWECRMLDKLSNALAIAQWMRWLDEGTFHKADPRQATRVNSRLNQLCRQFYSSP